MLKCHELFGFVSPALAQEILESAYASDKPLYRAILAAVAQANHVRPAFFEKKPRAQRHTDMLAALSRPRMEDAAASLLRGWLLKAQVGLVAGFLDALGIPHEQGVVEEFPATVEDAKLAAAIEQSLAQHPREVVILYLNTLKTTGGVEWPNLVALLQSDPRLQLA
ncbi:MAG: hypothetical protein ABSC03_18650 [Verrucomicrobiota bacterium]|jgi:hypothetical protein